MSTWELIKSDLVRYAGFYSFGGLVKYFFYLRSFKYCVWYRLSNSPNGAVSFLAKVRLKFLIWKTGIDIPPGTQIGPGFYIGHGQSVVVSPTCTIGKNCNISQFVTIGTNHGRAATIGDNVYIGPSVCIVEDVTIGNNVTIGAGSVVVHDIPDNATVAGVPAKVINYNSPGRYVNRRWS